MVPVKDSQERQVVQAREILVKIEKGEPIKYENVIVKGDLDLSTLRLPTKFHIRYVVAPIVIINSNIQGILRFDKTTFQEYIHFDRTYFNDTADFGESEFNGYANFEEATFAGHANFSNAKFGRYANFKRVKSDGDVDFWGTKFGENAIFSDAQLVRKVEFEGAEFSGDVDFSNAMFGRNTNFGEANFSKNAYFTGTQFEGTAFFWNARFNRNVTFAAAQFNSSFKFDHAYFGGSVDITDTKFRNEMEMIQLKGYIQYLNLDPDNKANIEQSKEYGSNKNRDEIKQENPREDGKIEAHKIAALPLGDRWSKIDHLGYSDYAEALADFIKNKKSDEPLTIGVDAEWGVGKTTLMHMIKNYMDNQENSGQHGLWSKLDIKCKKIKKYLETKIRRIEIPQEAKEKSNITIWFNAWKYDQEESLWSALALEILTQIRSRFDVWQQIQFWFKLNFMRFDWMSLLQNTLRTLFYLLGVIWMGVFVLILALIIQGITFQDSIQVLWQNIEITGLLVGLPALYAAGKKTLEQIVKPFDLNITQYINDPKYELKVGFLAQFEEDFKRVIDLVTVHGEKKLVVFIDDLDRCAPSHVADIIEAINVLLDADHCVFVIGMDSLTVANSIRAKYKDLEDYEDDAHDSSGLTLGQRFLEKIIQINFHIPTPYPAVVKSFIDATLNSTEEQSKEETSNKKIREATQQIKAKLKDGKLLDEAAIEIQTSRSDLSEKELIKAKEEAFAESLDESNEVGEAAHDAIRYLEPNPRKIKRFINTFRLQALIANRRGLLESDVIRLDILAKWIVITMRWPQMIGLIESEKTSANRLGQEDVDRDVFLESLTVKQIPKASDLIDLIKTIPSDDFSNLIEYVHLAYTTEIILKINFGDYEY